MDNPQHISKDFDPSLEDDQLWDMLGTTSTVEPSGSFVQNTMRAARLSEPPRRSLLFWFTRPAVALCSAGAVTAMLVVGLVIFSSDSAHPPQLVDGPDSPVESTDWLQQNLLATALEEPSLFSDEEIVALVF